MLVFPNAKINIGLRVLRRRPDGYHDIDSVMVPIGWTDILEMVPSASGSTTFTMTGHTLGGCPPEKNLVMKALRALEAHLGRELPPLDIYLHKNIPDGAGLGGGSADASFALRAANDMLGLGLGDEELAAVAARVGADCPFFIYNRPMHVEGIGERLTPVSIPALSDMWVAVVKPRTEAVSTREAYAGVSPAVPSTPLLSAFDATPGSWLSLGAVNDFESSVFALRPVIADTLEAMRGAGALYASMSGSGSSVFGLFDNAKMAEDAAAMFDGCDTYAGKLSAD